jgi:site-specific DNA-methyltransferase (adenine-specific)
MKEHDRKIMFSKKSDEWATPQWLFDDLNKVHGFTLDPASTDENCKCPNHFTMEDDGLTKDWLGETVFINPPYSKCFDWVKKAHSEAQKESTKVVMLLPARTDTKWFHQFCLDKNVVNEVCFVKGRLKFGDQTNSAPFPSMVVTFGSGPRAGGILFNTRMNK